MIGINQRFLKGGPRISCIHATWELLKMYISRPHTRSTGSKTLGHLCFDNPSRCVWYGLKFAEHLSKAIVIILFPFPIAGLSIDMWPNLGPLEKESVREGEGAKAFFANLQMCMEISAFLARCYLSCMWHLELSLPLWKWGRCFLRKAEQKGQKYWSLCCCWASC